MDLFLKSNPITRISHIGTVNIEPKEIAPNPGRLTHGLVLFIDGKTDFVIGEKRITVGAGDLVYLPKGLKYGFVREYNATFLRFNFEIANSSEYPFFVRSYKNFPRLKELFLHMLHLESTKPAGYESLQFCDAYKIISIIQTNDSAVYHSNRQYQKIENSVKYLESHFIDADISTEKLAEMSKMSTRYYTTLFNSFFMCPPKKHINNLKIEHAKKLLLTTNALIHEISEECGFYDVYYFCKQFKKATDISPSEYRKRNSYL